MPKLSKRLAMRMALKNAAAIIDASDLEQIFADLYYDNCGDEDAVEVLSDAKDKVVKRIEAMVKE